ncbi:DUF3592 domain-containing protein [Pseudogulbenkiania subflava]|uniref:DUF3592 domain-containing protein n=1 Tax=Pseudogulbenkiania subflava DSM 22618 TaxID=1123014 RepID=A0A1Y6C2G7_9NEIS|nr:DUF3592 domain-containing protein [Pseudogulbenkiania subflava]SMF40379.1 Protein of unknown function [Pseudogulbenkiania subflava DSM 22618]
MRLIALVLLLIGGTAFVYLWKLGEKGQSATHWPSASGTIVESRLDTRLHTGGDGNRDDYLPQLRYRYSVGGVALESTIRRYPNPGAMQSQEQAQAVLARYPHGAVVRVYYNPERPQEACLEPGEHWTAWAGKALTLIVAAAGLVLLLKGND